MTDEQCVALLSVFMRSVLVLGDALTRKDLSQKPSVQQMTDEESVDLAWKILRLAKAGKVEGATIEAHLA